MMAPPSEASATCEAPPGPDGTPTATDSKDRGQPRSVILSGLSWNASSQLISVLVYLGLTPFLLHRLGLDAYGVFALVSSFWGLLSNLDGGLGPCATRYFAVFAGAKDRTATSQLLLTMSLMTVLVVGPVAAGAALVAPWFAALMHTSAQMRHESVTLIRLFMLLLLVYALRSHLTRIVTAEHRWAFFNMSMTASLFAYVGVAIVLVEHGGNLIALFWAGVAREGLMLVASALGARRHVSLRDMRLMPWRQCRELIRFASRVQIAAVASSFNFEIDALIVGLLFPVGDVGLYAIGVSFSTELASLPVNAVQPIVVLLSRTFGRDGLGATVVEFVRIQRVWVRAVAAYCLIGAASVIAGIPRWLGPKEQLSGIVAAVLLLGQGAQILSQVMGGLGKAVNRPGLESRYLSLGTTVNLVLAVPLALSIGMLGIPIGTSVGFVASTLYFTHLARREISSDLRSFFAEVPVLAVCVSVVVTGLLEVPTYILAPTGVLGLLCCAFPALAGLSLYALLTIPPAHLLSVWRWRRPLGPAKTPYRHAMVDLADKTNAAS